jgi:hypothetical protein
VAAALLVEQAKTWKRPVKKSKTRQTSIRLHLDRGSFVLNPKKNSLFLKEREFS